MILANFRLSSFNLLKISQFLRKTRLLIRKTRGCAGNSPKRADFATPTPVRRKVREKSEVDQNTGSRKGPMRFSMD